MSSSLHTLLTRSIVLVAAAAFGAGTLICGPAVADSGVLTVVDPRVDHASSPILVEDAPVFSWRSESGVRGAVQSAYRVVVSDAGGVVWDSGKVESSSSIDVVYGGAELAAMSEYSWTVTVWDGQGHASDPVTSVFRTGLRSTDGVTNWGGAQWITQTRQDPTYEDDRLLAVAYEISADVTDIDGGAGFTWAGMDDDYVLARIYHHDGAWRLGLYEGDANGITPFARDNSAEEDAASPRGYRPVAVDVELDRSFDPSAIHTLKVAVAGSEIFYGGNISPFAIAQDWTISLDGSDLATFSLPDYAGTIRLGRLGFYNPEGQSAKYSNIVINRTSPSRTDGIINETTDALGAAPASSIFAGVDGATIADGWITVTDAIAAEPMDPVGDPLFRKEFTLRGGVASAQLYATARGAYEARINGKRVGDQYLAPGYTDFNESILYQAYDVTDMLTRGSNAIGFSVGDGWYSGVNAAMLKPYGAQPSVMAMLRIVYEDGSVENIITDDTWRYSPDSPILESNLIHGENYDANREPALEGWSTAGFNESTWAEPGIAERPEAAVRGNQDAAITVVDEIAPISRNVDVNGNIVFDFGQNLVGNVRVAVSGAPGSTMELHYGEALNDSSLGADGPKGTVYNINYRSAKVTDYYTLGASGSGTFQPTFTFHGFRYLQVSGYDGFDPNAIGIDDVRAVVLSSAKDITMSFESSNEGLNQLHSNTVWGLRGNFLSIPTDTPARDERLGWMGDAQVFASTAVMTADVQSFFNKWLSVDLIDAQVDGYYPLFAPNAFFAKGNRTAGGTTNAWHDAGIIVTYAAYQAYGDTDLVRTNYGAMKAYERRLVGNARGGLADHLSLVETDSALVLEAYRVRVLEMIAEMAAAIGETADAEEFTAQAAAFREQFIATYFPDGTGILQGDKRATQTGYSLALNFGLVPAGHEVEAAAELAALTKNTAGESALNTGFLGTPNILPALSDNGETDAAYDLVLSHAYPSWLYTVDQGATTFWERWNSYTKDAGFGPATMNSFNHYAYGAVSKWIYNTVAGINADPASPGFQHVVLAPRIDDDGRVMWAKGVFDSPYGVIGSRWSVDDDGALTYRVEVPANASATVKFPGLGDGDTVYEGEVVASAAEGVTLVGIEGGVATLEVGSGSYVFTVGAAPVVSLAVDPAHVRQGESVTVSGGGFVPGAVVTLTAHSDPVVIADVTVDEAGGVSAVWSVPSDFPVGQHRVIASDEAGVELASASVVVVAADADVVPPGGGDAPSDGAGPGTLPGGGLSKTGASVVGVLVTALIVGAVGLALTRRRRAQS
ncbi:alpha-L-rhamnosidase [Actinomyces mediterranea]|uniref:alpha-L-rhamnosidase n=1 Tax=Actinomyces mediterranea TaxID=1871028 RepID=UPI00097099DB|nr:alpha-L-rhamnosidase [Actinomyces mediterranea]